MSEPHPSPDSSSESAPIVLVPGLGADARLFERLAPRLGGRLHVAEFVPDEPGDDLVAYAARMAESLPPAIRDARPVLGGMSFGGQIAVEMARRVDARAVAVIAGSRRPADLPWRFAMSRTLGGLVPAVAAGAALRRLAPVFIRRERLDAEAAATIRSMAADIDPRSLRRLGRVCSAWRDDTPPPAPLRAIHGRRDWVIPMRKGDGLTVLEDGRHLITFTHAEAVATWLEEVARGAKK